MKDQVTRTASVLKTTAIGGLIVLLPLAVVGGLLGYVYNVVRVVYEPLKHYLPQVRDLQGHPGGQRGW